MGITIGNSAGISMGNQHKHRNGVIAGISAYVIWGLLTLYWHAMSGIDAFSLIGWRIVGSAVLLGVVVFVTKSWRSLRPLASPQIFARTSLAAIALATNWTIYVFCVTHDRVVDAALGYLLSPLGLVLAGALILHEHLRFVQRCAIGLAALSVAVLAFGYGRPPVLAVLIALTWTLYGVLKKRVPFGPLIGLTSEAFVLLPLAIIALSAQQGFGDGALHGATTTQTQLIALAGVATAIPLLLFARAAQSVALSTLGWLQYIVPTINLALGVALYSEPMPPWRLAGFAVAWLALLAVSIDGLRNARAGSPTEPAVVPLEG